MKVKSEELIADLIERTRQCINATQKLKEKSDYQLNYKSDPESWSILECIEHLNLYGNYYLPEIEKRINKSSFEPSLYFNSGTIGNYFAKSLLPKEKLNKMKTFRDKNPVGSKLERNVLDCFISQQHKTLEL